VIYVIFSDVHANLEAFEAVLREFDDISPDRIICLGDIVGYGASPHKCIEIARGLTDHIVAGNHDFGVVGLTDIQYFNSIARAAIHWTAARITSEDKEFLKSLPLVYREQGKLRAVHASPSQPAMWHYIFTPHQALAEFKHFDEPICFIGHSHQAAIYELIDEHTVRAVQESIEIRQGRRYMINVGSVGQPRDFDPRACFCVYDSERGRIHFRRVAYDIATAQEKIVQAGLPPVLATRLSWGE